MRRITGRYQVTQAGGETVRAFIPDPLPPSRPALALDGESAARHAEAIAAMARLEVAGTMVPDADWFLYGFVRKEAVITSQIEGTQATLQDVLTFEIGQLHIAAVQTRNRYRRCRARRLDQFTIVTARFRSNPVVSDVRGHNWRCTSQ